MTLSTTVTEVAGPEAGLQNWETERAGEKENPPTPWSPLVVKGSRAHASFSLAASPALSCPCLASRSLPGSVPRRLALGRLLSLQSTGGTRATPSPSESARGPSVQVPAGCPPFLECGSSRLSPQPAAPGRPQASSCLEGGARLLEKTRPASSFPFSPVSSHRPVHVN